MILCTTVSHAHDLLHFYMFNVCLCSFCNYFRNVLNIAEWKTFLQIFAYL